MNIHGVPSEVVMIYNNALEFSARGEYGTALSEYHRAIERHPTFLEAYNNIGELHSRMGDSNRAITAYATALKIEWNHRVLLNMGVEYYNNDKYQKALEYFIESLRIKGDFLEGNLYAGQVYYRFKNYIEAEKHLARVVAEDRKHLKANYMLSHIYYERKEYRRVLDCLDQIRDIADNPEFISRYYGFCHYFLGNYAAAADFLSKAMESNPAYARFSSYLKNLTVESRLKEIGDLDAAIRELEAKMMSRESGIMDMKQLGILYIYKGRNTDAENLFVSIREKLVS